MSVRPRSVRGVEPLVCETCNRSIGKWQSGTQGLVWPKCSTHRWVVAEPDGLAGVEHSAISADHQPADVGSVR